MRLNPVRSSPQLSNTFGEGRMQIGPRKIAPCLWFDIEAEEAANFYVSVFKNSKIIKVARYPNEGQEIHGKEAGSVMAVDFELPGQKFAALNGGPQFTFDDAISFQIYCENQGELDYFWTGSPRVGKKDPVAGSRTNMGSPGRSCRSCCCR
jgi:predicted 3-demethylubiquinone-9 3-methyltransferase (glyoxalase superfamily)